MSNGEVTIIHLMARLTKKLFYIKMSYFSPQGHSKNKTEVELDLSNSAIKCGLKNATGDNTLQFPKKDDLAN